MLWVNATDYLSDSFVRFISKRVDEFFNKSGSIQVRNKALNDEQSS